jgi:hypothetical protein
VGNVAVLATGAAIGAAALVAAGCGGPDEAGRAAGVARAYLRAEGPAVCGYLSARQLTAFARGDTPGIEGCREAKQLHQGDTVAVSVEARGPVDIAGVSLDGDTGRIEGIDRQGRSVELDLVREDGAWRVDRDPDEIAGDASLVGARLSPTEGALFDALLFGPAPGDAPALRAALGVTRSWTRLVEADADLSPALRRRKLAWAIRLTDDGSCDPCRAVLVAARRSVG